MAVGGARGAASRERLRSCVWSEVDLVARVAFVLTWALLNFFFIATLRRPLPAAALTLMLIVLTVLLSRFKHGVLLMTANFLDVMIIDSDTVSFLLTIFPNLWWMVLGAAAIVIPAIGALWWFDPLPRADADGVARYGPELRGAVRAVARRAERSL